MRVLEVVCALCGKYLARTLFLSRAIRACYAFSLFLVGWFGVVAVAGVWHLRVLVCRTMYVL